MKRSLYLKGLDKELVITAVTELNLKKKVLEIAPYASELTLGEEPAWRLCYSLSLIPDISKLKALEIRGDKLIFEGLDLEVTLKKTVLIDGHFLELKEYPSGFVLLYGKKIIPDISKLEKMILVRED